MYDIKDKLCILCSDYAVTSRKFFQIKAVLDEIGWERFTESADCQSIIGNNYGSICKDLCYSDFTKRVDDLNKYGVIAVSCFSSLFPDSLKNIDEPPYILYCLGDVNLLKSDCIAVVGTRKVSSYGKRVTKDFTQVLCEKFTIVSGLAYGVDSVAHETTLENYGKTIAVLGGGIIDVYPSSNQGLADRIVANGGLLVSEYGVKAEPFSYRFPHRNRIVSGLSRAVLVCQAPAKSGTNSTVECALSQGKDVFAVPGEIYDSGYAGSNAMIKSIQCAFVTTPRDIIDFYGLEVQSKNSVTVQLDFEEQKVVDCLTIEQLSFDDIVRKTNLQPSVVNFVLTNLELKSIIARLPGNVYRLYGGIK